MYNKFRAYVSQNKQATYSACIRRHSESGRGTDALTTSGPKATSADMMSIHTLDNPDQLKPSATAASRPKSSRLTSTGRSHSCESDTLTQRSSGTSALDSTSGAKGYLPYWSDYTREISSALWSPTETVLRGLERNSSRHCSSATAGSSWFSISEISAPRRSSRLIFSPSSQFLESASTDSVATTRKSRKIRLYPDAGQRAELRSWFGAARYAYNQAVELLTSEDAPPAVKTKIRDLILPTLPPWHRNAPREVLVGAVFDACRAISAVKRRNGELARDKSRGSRQDEDFARVRFRSRKNPRQTFTVQANCVSDMGIYRTKLGDMQMAEKLPTPENRNICRLSLRYSQYHMSTPYDEKLQPRRENQARVVALDPGVRSFLTWYCADSVGKIGEGAFFRIQRLCERLDDLLSRAAKSPSRRRRNMRRAGNRMRIKIENLVTELHRQAARFLVDRFDVILLPTFETSEMVERGRRRIRSKTVRNLLSLAHYRFKLFLRHKAAETRAIVLDVSEAYTTKTVSWTGELQENLGGASVVVAQDGERMDRDYNGARGIYLRALGDIPALRDLFSECAASVSESRLSGNMSEDAQVSLFGSS